MLAWLASFAPRAGPSRASSSSSPADSSHASSRPASDSAPPSTPLSSAPLAGPSASPQDARTARNRKKRQQKKKAAQRHKRQATLNSHHPGDHPHEDGNDDDDDEGEDEDEREPDEDEIGAPAPEADDDLSYLDRIGGLRRQRQDKARQLAAANADVGGGIGSAGPTAGSAPIASGAAGGRSAAPRSGAGGGGAHDGFALPGEAPLDTRGMTAGPEQIEAAQLVTEMLRQGKIRPGPSGPFNRISGLPDGAGQVNGIEVPSTHEVRKKAKDSGLIPFTDDRGMLRIGVRVAPDVVLMHPKDGKGEPILLRMTSD